jgi:hypothetical protein
MRLPVMSEPSPILVLWAFEWRSMCRLAGKGERWAREQINGLFDAYRDQSLICICGQECDWPPFTQIMPVLDDKSRLLAVPLCQDCAKLPAMARHNMVAGSKGYIQQSRRVAVDFMPPRISQW